VRYVEAQGTTHVCTRASGSHLAECRCPARRTLPTPGFVRIHRSTLVSLTHVDVVRVRRAVQRAAGNDELPVKRRNPVSCATGSAPMTLAKSTWRMSEHRSERQRITHPRTDAGAAGSRPGR